jgi:DNA-binding winged helix-turn-helix (wHTH) protein/Tol biopolymer transport system component
MPAIETPPNAADRPRLPSLSFGPFAFDTHTRLLSRDGHEVALPPRVLGVLELLLRRAGDVVSRQELIDTVWKDAFVTDTSLAEAVSVLRQALADDPQSPTYIQTLHRRGYRFVAPVTPNGNQSAASRSAAEAARVEDVVSPSIGGQLVPWSAAVICALVAVAAVWQYTRQRELLTVPAVRFDVNTAPGTVFDEIAPALAVSTDGSMLAWSACGAEGCRVYRRALDSLESAPVAGTEDGHAPFFSPDGRWIGFFADGRLKKVEANGGNPVTLADAPTVLGGTWVNSAIVFAGGQSGGLMRVPADGGDSRPLTAPVEASGEVRHAWPSAVPGTSLLLFTITTTLDAGAPGTLAVLSLPDGAVAQPVSGTPRWRTLVAGAGTARAVASDVIVFGRDAELHAVRFDPVRLATAGAPEAVATQVAGARGRAQFSLSSTGTLFHAPAAPSSTDRGLLWWSEAGEVRVPIETRHVLEAALAPDGRRVALVRAEGARADIWVTDLQRGAATRLTHKGTSASPVWSADGQAVYYATRTDRAFEIWTRDADGAQPARRLLGGQRHTFPIAASVDGTTLAVAQSAEATGADIWALPLAGGAPRPLVQGPFDELAATFSPDGTLVAYQSAETGRWEIYAQRISDGRRVVVSTDGGMRPLWTREGFVYESRGRLIRATVAADAQAIRVTQLTPVTELRDRSLVGLAPDGRLLLHETAGAPASLGVVSIEWVRDVRSRLGPAVSMSR